MGDDWEKQSSGSLDIETRRESSSPDEVEPVESARDVHGWKWCFTLASILLSTFIYALDATIIADLQASIVTEFDAIQELPWLSVAYLLPATATTIPWGRVYYNFNAKWLFILDVLIFNLGSIICGASPTIGAMIAGRAIMGFGGSGLYVGCITLIAGTTTMAERPMYMSLTGLTWGAGVVLGPVIGGAFVQSSVGWRWGFYINPMIAAACMPIYFSLVPSKEPRPGATFKQRAVEMDYAGIVLQAAALTALVIAICWGGVTYPWSSGRVIALFVVSGVLWILLGIQQFWNIFTSLPRRIIPVQFFRSRSVLILFSATASGGACSFVPIFMVPLYFIFARGDTALDAAVRLLPFIVVMVVFVTINGAMMAKLGYYMPWYLVGGLLVVLGSALMYTVDPETPTSRVYGYTVPLGAGVGMFLQASFSVTQAVVDPDDVAPAIGFITYGQSLGITLALAIANSVLLNVGQKNIQNILPDEPPNNIRAALSGVNSVLVQSLSPELRTRVIEAIVSAMGSTYALAIAGGALVALMSLFMRREKLFGAA